MKPSIATQWTKYRAAVVPAGASPLQVQESRRAFYAGAQAVLLLQVQISVADVPDDVGAAFIGSLHDECAQFAEQIRAGKA